LSVHCHFLRNIGKLPLALVNASLTNVPVSKKRLTALLSTNRVEDNCTGPLTSFADAADRDARPGEQLVHTFLGPEDQCVPFTEPLAVVSVECTPVLKGRDQLPSWFKQVVQCEQHVDERFVADVVQEAGAVDDVLEAESCLAPFKVY
jgi:hypothetical protein